MKVILKKEYLHENWDEMGFQPYTCERPYVEYYAANDSGGVTLKEVGPFEGVSEAHEWITSHRGLEAQNHPHLN